ncbi:MAG: DUF1761 domain-containing protein [Bacteroidales bacterium]|nr:DUF1761 domain-containing protein [Bacteroidales bacterium]
MEIHFGQINYLTVIAAMITHQVIGALWYSPLLFGKHWANEVNIDFSKVNKTEAQKGFLYSALLSIIGMLLIAMLIDASRAYTFFYGALIGLISGVIVAIMTGINYIYESRSVKLFLITSLYPVLSFIISGGIIGLWQ